MTFFRYRSILRLNHLKLIDISDDWNQHMTFSVFVFGLVKYKKQSFIYSTKLIKSYVFDYQLFQALSAPFDLSLPSNFFGAVVRLPKAVRRLSLAAFRELCFWRLCWYHATGFRAGWCHNCLEHPVSPDSGPWSSCTVWRPYSIYPLCSYIEHLVVLPAPNIEPFHTAFLVLNRWLNICSDQNRQLLQECTCLQWQVELHWKKYFDLVIIFFLRIVRRLLTIFRFEITMRYTFIMQICNAAAYLIEYEFGEAFCKKSTLFNPTK